MSKISVKFEVVCYVIHDMMILRDPHTFNKRNVAFHTTFLYLWFGDEVWGDKDKKL